VVEHGDLPEDLESLKQLVLTMRQALASRDLHIEHLKLLSTAPKTGSVSMTSPGCGLNGPISTASHVGE
jgi:hypothetical protein